MYKVTEALRASKKGVPSRVQQTVRDFGIQQVWGGGEGRGGEGGGGGGAFRA